MNVAILGCGKLGLPMAALYASCGHHIIAVDSNEALIEQLTTHTFRTDEPEVEPLLKQYAANLSFERLPYEAVLKSDIVFIVVPTPSKADGTFTSEYVVTAARQIGTALHDKQGYTLVVVVSTLMPGQMDADVQPALEQTSGKRAGFGFGLCYSPEFIALGRVIEGLRKPDYVLIGHRQPQEAQLLKRFYETVTPALAHYMDYINAELAKLATNAYLSLKIAYANVLGQICETLPGANVDVVTQAVGADHRIGGAYLRAGLPAGGVCLPRDLDAMGVLSRPSFLTDIPKWNKFYFDEVAREIERRLRRKDHILVMGTAYSATSSLETQSWGYALEHALKDSGYDVLFCVRDEIAQEQVDEADTVILALPLDSYKSLRFHVGQMIFDLWRIIDFDTLPHGVGLYSLGVGAKVSEHV